MPRSRTFHALLLLAGLAAVMYLIISMFLPSSRRLIVGVDKSSGHVRTVRNNITFLPPHQFYRLSFEKREGMAQRDGLVQIRSKENVPVTINYRLRFTIGGSRLEDAKTLVRSGWSAWIRKRVAEAVSAVASQVPIEELLSPTSQFAQRRGVLRNIVAAHLKRAGLNVTAFEISRIEADRRSLLEYKRGELRRSARGVAGRVAIFAIDGADWDLLTELTYDGRIPNLAALTKGGASASLQTIQPMVSPLVWTTLETGVTPDRHGVIDFVDRTKAPVDARARRAPALWDIAEVFGRRAMVVNCWSDWPPQPVSTIVYDTPVQLVENAAYPPDIAARARQHAVPASTISYAHVRRFLNITNEEYDDAVASGNASDPINVFRNVLAKTWTDHRVAIDLYQQKQPLVTMVGYDGTDIVNHLFAPYHPPYREGISQTSYRRYWPAVANYYSEVDRLIGEWMQVLSDDTTVIIVSAHGFRWGQNRPRVPPVGRAAISDHRNPGVFIAYGNHVVPARVRPVSIYDIVPTVLAILGLPKSVEMPGEMVQWAFRDVTPVESVRVISYGEFFGERPLVGVTAIDGKQYLQALQAVGHIIDPSRALTPIFDDVQEANRPIPPQQWGQYAHWNNMGIELRKQGKLPESIDAFQKAIDLNPTRPISYLNMAMTLLDRQQFTAAEDVFIAGVSRGLPNAEQWFIDFAAYYRDHDMPSRAISILHKGRQIFPQSYAIAANLGSALSQMNRYTEGLPELERALTLQPSSTLALNNLGTFYAKKNDYARALDFWNRSLTIDPAQPQVRNAAAAARTRL